MGTTTNRGLRWPDATSSSNQLHTRIRELAEDVDTKFQFPNVRYHMRSAGESIPTGAWYTLIYWTPVDTHSRITWNGTSTFTILDAGMYDIRLQAMFRNENSSSGVRATQLLVNGGLQSGDYAPPIVGQGDYASSRCSVVMRLPANSTVQFQTLQNSGGPVTVHGSPWTNMSIARLN